MTVSSPQGSKFSFKTAASLKPSWFRALRTAANAMTTLDAGPKRIVLPPPTAEGGLSLAATLARRRSVRRFSVVSIDLAELGQLLWAGQGITHAHGHRTAPSAGGLYPLECYAVAARVDGVAPGIYHYRPRDHSLNLVRLGRSTQRGLLEAAQQDWFGEVRSQNFLPSLSHVVCFNG